MCTGIAQQRDYFQSSLLCFRMSHDELSLQLCGAVSCLHVWCSLCPFEPLLLNLWKRWQVVRLLKWYEKWVDSLITNVTPRLRLVWILFTVNLARYSSAFGGLCCHGLLSCLLSAGQSFVMLLLNCCVCHNLWDTVALFRWAATGIEPSC